MNWRPIIDAATFGLSSDLRRRRWSIVGWSLLIGLGAVIIGIPIFWGVGALAPTILGSPFGFDIQGYHEPESAHLSDHIRYVWVGFVLVVGGYWIGRVALAFLGEWEDWSKAKRKLKAERAVKRSHTDL